MNKQLFQVYDKEKKEIVDYKGGYAGGGLAITQEGDLVFLKSLEWDYPKKPSRYKIIWNKIKKGDFMGDAMNKYEKACKEFLKGCTCVLPDLQEGCPECLKAFCDHIRRLAQQEKYDEMNIYCIGKEKTNGRRKTTKRSGDSV